MTESANQDSLEPTVRQLKKQKTHSRLTAVSRRLTAQRGLSGFTIDELCAEVDISRRTFFNYFATKEDAVIGADPDEQLERFAAAFRARGSRGWAAVLDDAVDLVILNVGAAGVDATAHSDFMTALEREPRLFARFIGMTRDRERQLIALVAEREGVSVDDPRAEVTVNILSTVIRTTWDRFLRTANHDDFSTTIRTSLAAFRAVLADPISRKETP